MTGTLGGVVAPTSVRRIAPRKNVFWGWFVGVNLSLLAVVLLFPFAVFFPFIGMAGAFISLFLAKWLAKRAHGIQTIKPELFRSDADERLYHLVANLRASQHSVAIQGAFAPPGDLGQVQKPDIRGIGPKVR